MSHKFLLFQPSKPAFRHDSTALEILNNYSKIGLRPEEKPLHASKVPDQIISNCTLEDGGILVYDVKAEMIKGEPSPQRLLEQEIFPVQEINETSKVYTDLKNYLQSKKFTPVPEFNSEYTLTVPDDGVTLAFNSKFECGNLKKAVKVSEFSYKLTISSDINTYGQNHWYYFSVFNPRKTLITFEIQNMLKFDDLYKTGLKPAVYSTKYFDKTGIKWHRDGLNITYKPNKNFVPGRSFYSLSFSYDFRYAGDTVFFAYSIPYTYSELSNFLQYIREKHQKIARVNPMCKTLAGNTCEMITITENIKSYTPFEEEFHKWGVSSSGRKMLKNKKKRKLVQSKIMGKELDEEHAGKAGIVLTSRVHAGETVSSFMVNGAIEFLLGESREARVLRKKFVFKIVPMLNPDGVRYGNYRCSLIGVDLNRRWEKPSRNLHPTIFYTKKMIEVFAEDHKLMMCCDMHGHSKKRNVFMYGCAIKSMDCLTLRKNLMAKVIPVMLNQKNKFFTFKDCHFRLEKSKMSTERIVVYNELNIPHSYTIEASFFGPLNKKIESTSYHMNEKDLESIGEDLCKSCMIFASQNNYLAKIRWTNDFLRKIMYKRHKKSENSDKKSSASDNEDEEPNSIQIEIDSHTNPVPLKLEDDKMWDGIEIVDYSESDEEGSGGSDSCPSEKIESPVMNVPLKRRVKVKKKNTSEPVAKNEEMKPEFTQSTNENIEEEKQDKQEMLRKTHSLKPQFRAIQSKKNHSNDVTNKSVPPSNLRSQNIMFNYPMSSAMPAVNEAVNKTFITESLNKSLNFENPNKNNRDIGKRLQLASQKNLNEDISNSLIGTSRPINYSFERNVYKKQERDQSFLSYSKNVFSEFSWSTRPGYLAKNVADTARFRIDKMYSKFSN